MTTPAHDERREHPAWKRAQRLHFVLELLSAVGAVLLILFFAIGFQFKTPAKWLGETNLRVDTLTRRLNAVETTQTGLLNRIDVITRVTCSRLTLAQLEVVPECDAFRRRGFPKTP